MAGVTPRLFSQASSDSAKTNGIKLTRSKTGQATHNGEVREWGLKTRGESVAIGVCIDIDGGTISFVKNRSDAKPAFVNVQARCGFVPVFSARIIFGDRDALKVFVCDCFAVPLLPNPIILK